MKYLLLIVEALYLLFLFVALSLSAHVGGESLTGVFSKSPMTFFILVLAILCTILVVIGIIFRKKPNYSSDICFIISMILFAISIGMFLQLR